MKKITNVKIEKVNLNLEENMGDYKYINPKVRGELMYSGSIPEEPIGFKIVPSGWKDFFYVIIEFGEWEDYVVKYMHKEEILKEYEIDLSNHKNMKSISFENGNDQLFGAVIRNLINANL
jgi:hypothetical protein